MPARIVKHVGQTNAARPRAGRRNRRAQRHLDTSLYTPLDLRHHDQPVTVRWRADFLHPEAPLAEYTKPWHSLEQQVDRLASKGVDVAPHSETEALLAAVGYYRLAGYLYPFRDSMQHIDKAGRPRTTILSQYRPGTSIAHVTKVIDFDRHLRMLALEGVERVEVALRMRIAYVLGARSQLAHLDPATFVASFTEHQVDEATGWRSRASKHAEWLQRVAQRRNGSDEAFVAHFRDQYEGQMPIWALTEILELGQLSRLYQGLNEDEAGEIAAAFGVPTKKVMASWIASLNYVRNVAAHHARLFNRKLQYAPGRPRVGVIPLLDHLRDDDLPKGAFGVYAALAVTAYLLRSIESDRSNWSGRLVALLRAFPHAEHLPLASLGAPNGWDEKPLWHPASPLQR